jgi:hypothetical protein
MNNSPSIKLGKGFYHKMALLGALLMTAILIAVGNASAQTTNAYDVAANSAYDNSGPPNGLSPGGQNGGFGFGPWTFTILNTGGAFINGSGPSGDSFDLWNTSASSSTVAVRPFSSPLVPGQSFSVQLCLNSLDYSGDTNALILQDSSGNTIFSYWHVGYEPNNGVNGEYSDATTNDGAAVNFQYAYQQFQSYTFTLNSPTTYTFTDNSTSASFTGTISNSQIAQVAFFRGNSSVGTAGGGDDFQLDVLQILSATPPTFGVTPAQGALSVPVTNSIVANVAAGSVGLNTSVASMTVDGGPVTPTVGGSSSLMTVSYTPNPPLSAGTTHTVQLVVQDDNAVSYTNIWSFTTGFASLPAVLPGPFTVSNNVDLTIFTAAGDPWLGTNYLSTSSQTLYARFSMEFDTTNDNASTIYTFGGMDFFQGSSEMILFGKNGGSANWSIADNGANGPDLNPSVMVVTNDWHTIVVEVEYQDGAPANETVWLDPDFTQTLANQPQSPVTLTAANTFDNVHLRAGFSDASATYSNIIIAATSAGLGFVAPSSPTFEDFMPGQNASSAPTNTPIDVEVLFGTYAISTNTVTLNLDGNNVTPAFTVTTNSITVNYQTPTPYAAGSSHTVTVSLTDSSGTPYSTSWSFTVDPYPSLPVVAAGPFDIFGVDDIIWTAQNEWIGDNYGPTSTNTLYTRFSMTFLNLNGKTTDGGAYGGLEFYLGDTEHFLIGDNDGSTNWSVSVDTENTADIPPVTPIVLGQWHTMVVKSVYSINAETNATEEVWLDPDFTKAEGNQPNAPLTLTLNNTFNDIHLRAGGGTTYAEYTNVVMAATAQGVGFATAVPAGVLSIQNLAGSNQLSWTGTGTLQVAPAVTGPWTVSVNQSNPQTLSVTNPAQFFRLQQ